MWCSLHLVHVSDVAVVIEVKSRLAAFNTHNVIMQTFITPQLLLLPLLLLLLLLLLIIILLQFFVYLRTELNDDNNDDDTILIFCVSFVAFSGIWLLYSFFISGPVSCGEILIVVPEWAGLWTLDTNRRWYVPRGVLHVLVRENDGGAPFSSP
jgi:hypothetical protein